jgi:hypothetical protein
MQKSLRIIAAAAICLAAQSAFSQTRIEQPDCGQWVKGGYLTKQQHNGWLTGYLTGINFAHWSMTNEGPLSALSSAEQAFAWMDNYCKANPLSNVLVGGAKLMIELREKAKTRK